MIKKSITKFYQSIFIGSYHKYSIKKSIEQLNYNNTRKKQLQLQKQSLYNNFQPTTSLKLFIQKYYGKQQLNIIQQKISGRVSAIRKHGKTTFIDIREQHYKIQLALTKDLNQQIKRGDIVGAIGQAFLTKKGELSLKTNTIQLLSPCLWMLPQYQSLKNQQVRYRNRHIDLITNQQSMNKLKVRAKIISFIRKYLDNRGYIQVETPTLSKSCGGAIAKPFKTYHNEHKMNLYMRIAPQLYLKKLLIGGFTKVYQIGKNFRNQSIDNTHNPQFTSCQLYCAYANYQHMFLLTQDLISNLVKQINGSYQIKTSKGQIIDLTPPWKKVQYIGQLQNILKIQFPLNYQNQQFNKFLKQIYHNQKISLPSNQQYDNSKLLDKLSQRYVQKLHKVMFIRDHPRIISPLSKPIKNKPWLTQRFQLFINGWEIVNSYTQLNNPQLQAENTPNDQDFVQALGYGLMPCAGWGIGIDRLVMLLTNSQKIQQVIAFPLLGDLDKQQKKQNQGQKKEYKKKIDNENIYK